MDELRGSPGPEPADTTGLEGGGLSPGAIPPAESSFTGAGPRETHNPPQRLGQGALDADSRPGRCGCGVLPGGLPLVLIL
ncbi:DUF6480 family protein [Streptomyces sp. NPDC096198]|uniref:DUF6480 family protein n=1 Tax=Streptomyces sp. NPDC096198 TaxID=3366080 RepID=UPI00382A2B15